jgi:glutamate/tyrosine decarboxylase-like PLP-dependent enzyme
MSDQRWGDETARLLHRTADLAIDYLGGLPERPVHATASADQLRATLGGDLPDGPTDPGDLPALLEALSAAAEPGLIASAGPRFFGFVIGGTLPTALAADWLVSAWDQDAGLYAIGPSAAVAEETAARWILELLGLPPTSGVGFTTGCQMAHVVCLAAARRGVLLRAGWDVERQGLVGSPPITVIAGGEVHVTVPIALQLLGLGADRLLRTNVDGQGRMDLGSLRRLVEATDGPLIVCAQAGNVNTGAFDPIDAVADVVAGHPGAWLHVDGAFGLWARVVPALAPLAEGVERADSWATDAHKWLNVPYDCGVAIVRDRTVHHDAVMLAAAYLIQSGGVERDNSDWVTEFSRRARGWTVYAALRSLGRSGVADLVERCCALARRMAERASTIEGVRVLNEVPLNQVLLRFGDDDTLTRAVVKRLQDDGVAWTSGSTWQGRAVMRLSVSNWSTTEGDADRTVEAIAAAWRAVRAGEHTNA